MSKSAMTMVPFNVSNAYDLRSEIKNCKGQFDENRKVWNVPQGSLEYLTTLSKQLLEKSADRSKKVWQEACKIHGHKFVRKGTPEYDQVLLTFKNLIKQVEKEDQEEEENEDDVVFD